jgi:hypothetical protein
MSQPASYVWVFNSGWKGFPSGVFTTRELAENWIAENHLSGTLTKYPLNLGVYHWAIQTGLFKPKAEYQHQARFIATFSSASQEHYHYEDGLGE